MNAETSKVEVITRILKNETYTQDSEAYSRVFRALMKLSLNDLKNLELILIFRISESNDLCRQVDKILAK